MQLQVFYQLSWSNIRDFIILFNVQKRRQGQKVVYKRRGFNKASKLKAFKKRISSISSIMLSKASLILRQLPIIKAQSYNIKRRDKTFKTIEIDVNIGVIISLNVHTPADPTISPLWWQPEILPTCQLELDDQSLLKRHKWNSRRRYGVG